MGGNYKNILKFIFLKKASVFLESVLLLYVSFRLSLLCMCVCVVYVCISLCVYACRGQKSTSCVFLSLHLVI